MNPWEQHLTEAQRRIADAILARAQPLEIIPARIPMWQHPARPRTREIFDPTTMRLRAVRVKG